MYKIAYNIVPIQELIEKYNIHSLEDAYKCKELWDVNNGITLCEKCHRDIHFKNDNTASIQ